MKKGIFLFLQAKKSQYFIFYYENHDDVYMFFGLGKD